MIGVYIIAFFYMGEFTAILTSWWLSYWSQKSSSGEHVNPWFYLFIYIILNMTVVMASMWREYYVRMKSLHASKTLFEELVTAVLYAPMSFYDTTPLGK